MRASRNSRLRAGVLIAVNLLIVAHIIQWLVHGMTLSPIEPSESMYTLEFGRLNAGFVFFAGSLVATFFFGRFVCGWGCHIIAVQDLCTWMLGKVGVRPKPLRSRLLLWAPLSLALYMFVWPTFKREALFPLLAALKINAPSWMDPPIEFPGFTSRFMTTDYWATFPPWYLIVPFLLVCGFATVYFLGSKGFCTYGCPYGGFFAPVDKVSIGRIVVSDACHQCGHCTAACTSNVRVHQEVRDYGMVIDPGCMKCLDCVSVCPNDALSFKFGAPAVLAKPRTAAAKAGLSVRPKYDLSWPQEAGVALVGFAVFWSVRGMLDSVPLLMAAGIGSVGGYLAWKIWQVLTQPHARVQNLLIKRAGTLRASGWGFLLVCAGFFGIAGWSGYVHYHRWQGDLLDRRVTAPMSAVFRPGYVPDPVQKDLALRAVAHLEKGGESARGGVGWKHQPRTMTRIAWLAAVAGDLPKGESYLREALETGTPSSELAFGLANMLMLQNKPADEAKAVYERVLARDPDLHDVRLSLATMYLQNGMGDRALETLEHVVHFQKTEPLPSQLLRAAAIMSDAGRPSDAIELLKGAAAKRPQEPEYHFGLGQLLAISGAFDAAIPELRESLRLDPQNPIRMRTLAEVLNEAGQGAEAEQLMQAAQRIEKPTGR